MDFLRRNLLITAAMAPLEVLAEPISTVNDPAKSMILSDFHTGEGLEGIGSSWTGFTDRVMGGVSNADFQSATVSGRRCIRLTGQVTTANGGGFVQMALDLAPRSGGFDASAYGGLELLVHGNNEDYNIHLRTADVSWYDQSYRATVFLEPEWQLVRLPWESFIPNSITEPFDASRLQRIGLLGWMREFEADIALSRIALYA